MSKLGEAYAPGELFTTFNDAWPRERKLKWIVESADVLRLYIEKFRQEAPIDSRSPLMPSLVKLREAFQKKIRNQSRLTWRVCLGYLPGTTTTPLDALRDGWKPAHPEHDAALMENLKYVEDAAQRLADSTAQATRADGGEGDGVGSDLPIDDTQAAILRVLRGAKRLLKQWEIADGVDELLGKTPDHKTMKGALDPMEKAGIVERPSGARKGYRLTDKGKALAAKHAAD